MRNLQKDVAHIYEIYYLISSQKIFDVKYRLFYICRKNIKCGSNEVEVEK